MGFDADQYKSYLQQRSLEELADEYWQICSVDRIVQRQREILVPLLVERMKAIGLNSLDRESFKVSLVRSKTSRLDKRLLLENGVPPSVIERSTVVTEYETVRATPKAS